MQKFWSLLFAAVILAEVVLVLIAPRMGWGLPTDVSSYGWEVDQLFHLILFITGAVFIVVEGVLIYYMWAYAAEPGTSRKALYTHGNHRLELAWTAVPAVVLLFIAFAQVGAWERIKYQSRMPPPQQVIEVSARQFEWRMRYPSPERLEEMERDRTEMLKFPSEPRPSDIHVVNELHIWKDADARVFLKTRDVLHSFFLPNLRVKQDAVPGKVIPVYFKATASNVDPATGQVTENWELACAELCGWGHYKMNGRVFVHADKADFVRWLRRAHEQENNRTTP